MATRRTTSTKTTKPKAASTRRTKSATSTTAKSPAKTASRPKRAVPKAATPKPTVVKQSTTTVAAPDLKKKELIEAVVEKSGIKKKYAKPVVETMLAVLGDAIENGREMNLQPLGRVMFNRTVEKANARVTVAKIRQSKAQKNPGEGAKSEVADAAE